MVVDVILVGMVIYLLLFVMVVERLLVTWIFAGVGPVVMLLFVASDAKISIATIVVTLEVIFAVVTEVLLVAMVVKI